MKAFGTYTFTANGAWTFTAFSGIANASPVQADFRYELKDGDGDTSQANQPITVTDGTGPRGPEAVALVVDDENLADGTNPAGPDFDTETVTFTVGSDPIVNISFDSDLGNLLGLTWSPNGPNQIIGYDGATAVIKLDLSHVPNSDVATVTATLLNDFDSHPTFTADDLQSLGSVKVIATDLDGDPAEAIVNIGVSDDVPVILGVSQDGSGSNLIWNGSFGDALAGPPQYAWGSVFPSLNGWTLAPSLTEPAATPQFELVVDGYQGMTTPEGELMLDMGASPGNIQISQVVQGLTDGQTYTLEFWAGAPHPDTATLEVWFGGDISRHDRSRHDHAALQLHGAGRCKYRAEIH